MGSSTLLLSELWPITGRGEEWRSVSWWTGIYCCWSRMADHELVTISSSGGCRWESSCSDAFFYSTELVLGCWMSGPKKRRKEDSAEQHKLFFPYQHWRLVPSGYGWSHGLIRWDFIGKQLRKVDWLKELVWSLLDSVWMLPLVGKHSREREGRRQTMTVTSLVDSPLSLSWLYSRAVKIGQKRCLNIRSKNI